MIPYWIFFSIPAWFAIGTTRPVLYSSKRWTGKWKSMFFILVLMIGLRHEVGGDWYNYLGHINSAAYQTFSEAVTFNEPAYGLLSWFSSRIEWGAYFLNTVCAFIFSWGLVVYSRRQPRPWLAMTVAVPYLVIVVAMGYTRQGAAIGLAMLGLVALADRRLLRFVLFIALAAAFHKSAVILMPLAALSSSKNRFFTVIWIGFFSVVFYWLFLQNSVEGLKQNYLDVEMQSAGAVIRVFMNAVPAALFLLYRSRFQLSRDEHNFWTWMSLIALCFVVLLKFSSSTTAVDRVALYMIPLQLFVLSRIPEVLGRISGRGNEGWGMAVVAYSALVQFIWLFFGVHSNWWLPYQFFPWVWLTQ
jgi:hypothetical protein